MNSWKIIFATILIFGAGVVAGALFVNHSNQKKVADLAKANPVATPIATNAAPARLAAPAGMEQRRIEFMRNVSKELGLSPVQKTRVDEIVHERQEYVRKIWEPVWDSIVPKLREQITNAHDDIVAQLTPEQRDKFEELLKRPPPKKDAATNKPPQDVRSLVSTNDAQSRSNIVAPLGAPANP